MEIRGIIPAMATPMNADGSVDVGAVKALVDALKTMLGIYAKVRIVSPKSITRSEGKAVRIIDKRKI